MPDSNVKHYEPNWESLRAYEVPEWFINDKFGIFIHWGVYSVPAFGNEWYPRKMYLEGTEEFEHHRTTWGNQKEFGYKDFIPMFKAEKFDAEAWVDLFAKSGARYVVPVAEHHDGFPMYDCSFTNYNAAKMGPCRDTIKELEVATRKAGLKFGVSSHRAFNWRFFTFSEAFDNNNPDYHKLYGIPHKTEEPVSYAFILDWYARTRELVELFSPEILWFDFGWHREEFEPYWPKLTAYYYNHALEHGYEPVLQYKKRIPDDVAVLDIERGKLDVIRPFIWQTDTSISYNSWGYVHNDDFKSVTSLVHDLVDIVSKNGNLLLNIGPRPDGTIPEDAQQTLLGIGEWLKINGPAIFHTRPYSVYGEGPVGVPKAFDEKAQQAYSAEDIRFTTNGDTLYATCLGWPEDAWLIKSLNTNSVKVTSVEMLGSEEILTWTQDESGLKVQAPVSKPCDHAYVLSLTLA